MSHLDSRLRHELNMLCRIGVGLAPIAPDACRIAREYVGAAAGAIFWLNEASMPEGFFHEDTPDEAKELFLNEFEHLFAGPHELNVVALAKNKGVQTGYLLHPETSYWRSNTFNLLVRASNHYHALDLRIDLNGQARAVLLLFRHEHEPFQSEDAVRFNELAPYFERAIAASSNHSWRLTAQPAGYMLLDTTNLKLVSASPEAIELLKHCHLVGQNISLTTGLTQAPLFVTQLCHRFMNQTGSSNTLHLNLPSGRLTVSASLLQSPNDIAHRQILINLQLSQSDHLDMVRNIFKLKLSPTQREIALYAAMGGERADCARMIGVSAEALKKHLAVLYEALNVHTWHELTALFAAGSGSV